MQRMYLKAGSHHGLSGAHGGGTRSVVMGREGVVSTAHWLASQEALRVLEEGGNAFDAAVCAAAVVSIAEPYMSGGVGAALVPGVVAGWSALVERCGTMDLARLLEPAIQCAARGVPVSILCAEQIASSAARLARSEASFRVF